MFFFFSFSRFWGTTCSPSLPNWRAWISSRTTSPWWRTAPSLACHSSPRCSSSTTGWKQPRRRSCSPCLALPTSVSMTTPGAAAAHWTTWFGPCRCPPTAIWATTPSAPSHCHWGARSWKSWVWSCCVQVPTRWTTGRGAATGEDQSLLLSRWNQRPPPCVTPTCSPNLCWTAATKVRISSCWNVGKCLKLECFVDYCGAWGKL